MTKLTFITSNEDKIKSVKEVFSNVTNIDLHFVHNDIPEIQGNSSVEIARETALHYARHVNGLVVREDHSLYIRSLYPFPGPYTNFFNNSMPVETLLSMMKNMSDRTGYFELAAVLADTNGKTKEFVYRVKINISEYAVGDKGNWDRVLILDGEELTFSQKAQKNIVTSEHIWHQNYIHILNHLKT